MLSTETPNNTKRALQPLSPPSRYHTAKCITYTLGINAITGQPRDEAPPSSKIQDYVVVPHQRWLDGICTASGVVRQVLPLSLPIFQGAVTLNSLVF
jgi:hypothetical protein